MRGRDSGTDDDVSKSRADGSYRASSGSEKAERAAGGGQSGGAIREETEDDKSIRLECRRATRDTRSDSVPQDVRESARAERRVVLTAAWQRRLRGCRTKVDAAGKKRGLHLLTVVRAAAAPFC